MNRSLRSAFWLLAPSFWLLFVSPVQALSGSDLHLVSLNGENGVVIEGRGINRMAQFQLHNTSSSNVRITKLDLENVGNVILDRNYQFIELRDAQNIPVAKARPMQGQWLTFTPRKLIIEAQSHGNFSLWGRTGSSLLGRNIKIEYRDAELKETTMRVTNRWQNPQRKPRRTAIRANAFRRTMRRMNRRSGSLRRRRVATNRRTMVAHRRSSRSPRVLTRQQLTNKKLAERPYTRFLKLTRPIGVPEILVWIAPGSRAGDKNGNGISNEVEDYKLAFESFNLKIDGVSVSDSNDIRESDGKLWLVFSGDFKLTRQHEIGITTVKSNVATANDRVIPMISERYSFPNATFLRGRY